MTAKDRESDRHGSGLARHSLFVVLVTVSLLGLGFLPTWRIGGLEAVGGQVAGCAISAMAGWAGMLLVGRLSGRASMPTLGPGDRLTAMLVPMIVRLVLVVVLGLAAALSELFESRALLIWLAISYMALLPVETAFAVRRLGSLRSDHP